MDTKVTKEWAYKITSSTTLNFYHILFPHIGVGFVTECLSDYKKVELKNSHYLTITTETPLDLQLLIKNLEEKLESEQPKFSQTKNCIYEVTPKNRQFIKDWFLSIQGAIALITIAKCQDLKLNAYDFELLNSSIGGIYLHPHSVLFYKNYAKVIHPIRVNNYFLRREMEKTIAKSMRGILKRAGEASKGQEGLAIVSYVEDKTKFPQSFITQIISEKAKIVRLPKYSPIFNSL